MIRIDINPLSVNETWKGKRFKTNAYVSYEKLLMYLLPKIQLPKVPYFIAFEFGFSNKGSDWDNPIKPLQDVLQKKYGFNDKDVFEATISKKIVKKGEEYVKFRVCDEKEYIEIERLNRAAHFLLEILKKLDNKGGLGLDVHRLIKEGIHVAEVGRF